MHFATKSSWPLLAIFTVLCASGVFAAPGMGLSDDDRALLQRSLEIQERARQNESSEDNRFREQYQAIQSQANNNPSSSDADWLDNTAKLYSAIQQGDALTEDFLGQSGGNLQTSAPHNRRPLDRVDVLVSESMGQGELRTVTQLAMRCMAASDVPVRLVYRGIQESDSFATFTQRQQGYLSEIRQGHSGPIPNIVIDIDPFEEFSQDGFVPVSISYRSGKDPVVRPGIIDPCFDPNDPLHEQAAELVMASEAPMLELIEKRLAQIDWEKKKKEMQARYYAGLPSPKLPPATIADTRLVSMDVKIIQDIEMPNGEIIARRGDVINPLSVSPLLEHYIVINASIPDQVAWAKTYIADNPSQSVVVMLDGAPEPKSPESFYELELSLKAEVFLLNESVESRFHIKKTPSVISQADERNIQVSEVALND